VSRPERLEDDRIDDWLGLHGEWRIEDAHLVREVVTTDYPSAIRIVDAQVEICERLDHHPMITIGYRTLQFELWTHDRDGVTQLDLQYAEGLDTILNERKGDLAT